MQAEAESTPGVVPVHHQIADDLRAKIVRGDLAPGDPVPSVNELAKQWGCSPGTARTAIRLLLGEGRISGGAGRRATVRPSMQRIRMSVDLNQRQKDLVLESAEDRAATGAIELTAGLSIKDTKFVNSYTTITANGDLAAEFGIPEGSELLRREYENSRQDTGTRLSWSQSYIPVSLIESNHDLLDESKEPWPGGHQHQLYTVGIEIDRVERSVGARETTPADRARWDMQPGVPILRVRSRSIDVADRVVELSDAEYPADRIDLVFTEKLNRWPEGYPRFVKDGE
ncbi:GntR family transcriptional regulator [Catenuloplanes japonicus]|uniref:GntR family transcriptional regulator n=1 Tax=Catenuloplanes japonicus TaxID=33876 RepID=UPI000A0F7C8D|nr:GntR family transcriptional regulator [Catenuloplanes japonicus]